MANLFSLCLHRESLTSLCVSAKLENVTCSCQDTKIWLFVMFCPHLLFFFFLLGQTALIWSTCVEVQSSQVLFTNVPKQEMVHWCFRANCPGTILVSSGVSSVVLFLSSFCSFFLSFQVPPQLLALSSFFLLSSTSVLFPKTENPWAPLLRSW